MTSKQQTPLEKLRAEKLRLNKACEIQERKLNDHLTYVQENAGSLILSGLSALLFPSSPNKGKKQATGTDTKHENASPVSIGVGDYLSIAKGLAPLFWEIAQPVIASWGIRKVRKWITNKLFKKKSPTKDSGDVGR